MQILGLWKDRKAGAEKRKRASAEDFFDTEDRKRIKAAVDSPSRGSPENEAVPDAKEPLPSPSPLHTSTLRSPTDAPSSPPMRPDRRRNIRDSDAPPLDSLPTSPGHAPDDSTVPERSRKLLIFFSPPQIDLRHDIITCITLTCLSSTCHHVS